MKTICLCAAACLGASTLLTGCGKPVLPVVAQKTVGDLAIALTASRTPQAGDNAFRVTLTDAATHAALGRARITARFQSLPQNSLGRPSRAVPVGNGAYRVSLRLPAAGRYDIALHVERPHAPAADVSFPVTVK